MPARAIVTLLFSDVVVGRGAGSDEESADHRRSHLRQVKEAVGQRRGAEVRILGDGVVVAFASALDAAHVAVQLQRIVAGDNVRSGRSVGVRVGLHVGEPPADEEDYFGLPMVVARRLCESGAPGEVLVSGLVRSLLAGRGEFAFEDRDAIAVQGATGPVAVSVLRAPSQAAPPPGVPRPLVARDDVFVGRGPELAALRVAWEQAARGHLGAVLVAGEPGIGKTRLAGELARELAAGPAQVLYGRCDEDAGLAFQPFVEALRDLPLATLTTAEAHAAALSRMFPEQGAAVAPPPAADATPDRYVLFEAVADVLANASASAPLLLVLDDLHWALKPTLLLLRHVLRTPRPVAALVVGSYRDTEVDRTHPLSEMIADLRREARVERITLRGLDEDAIVAYLEATADLVSADDGREVARLVLNETGGNPFFVAEVVRHLTHSGVLRPRGTTLATAAQLVLPDSLREAVDSRVGRLSESTRRLLQIAAVVGRVFAVAVVERVPDAGLDVDGVLDALDEATAAGLLLEEGDHYAFTHDLVHQTVYQEMLAARRAQLHLRVAAAMEQLPPGARHAADLAHHYGVAATTWPDAAAKAVAYGREAAREAMAQLAFEDAATHAERAIEVLRLVQGADDRSRAELMVEAAGAMCRAGQVLRAGDLARDAAKIAQDAGDGPLLAQAALRFEEAAWTAHGFMLSADVAQSRELLEGALARLPSAPSALRVDVLTRLPRVMFFAAPHETRRFADEAIAQAAALGDPALEAAAAEAERWSVLAGDDDPVEQLRVSERMLDHAVAAGDRSAESRAHVWLYVARLEIGDLDGVDGEIAELDRLRDVLRDPLMQWYPLSARAMRALLRGELRDAEARAFEAYAVAQRFDMEWAVQSFGIQLYFLRREQGDVAGLEDPTRRLIERQPLVVAMRCALADLYCQVGRDADAVAMARESAALLDRASAYERSLALGLLADVCAYIGDAHLARSLRIALAPYAGRNLVVRPTGNVCMGSTDRNLAVLAATAGDFTAAESHFEAAMAFNERLGAAPWIARTAAAWAVMLEGRGLADDVDRAAALRAKAEHVGHEAGIRVRGIRGFGDG